MKMKRFMSLLLALVMSLSMAVPAFAAEPDDPDEGIMPLQQIYDDEEIMIGGSHFETISFAATPGNGKTIHVWCQNATEYPMEIRLFRTDTNKEVLSDTVNAYSNWSSDYVNSTADSGIYRVQLTIRGNHAIHCRLAVAQYR